MARGNTLGSMGHTILALGNLYVWLSWFCHALVLRTGGYELFLQWLGLGLQYQLTPGLSLI